MKKMGLVIAAVVMMLFVWKSGMAAEPDVRVMQKAGVGGYLADADGMTLYWYKNDSKGRSTCRGACIDRWPAFFTGAVLSAAPSMQQDDFGTIRRPEGKMQNTFRGMPLYYYAMDRKPGDTMGHKMNNLWFVIDPLKFVAPEKQLYGNPKPAVGKE